MANDQRCASATERDWRARQRAFAAHLRDPRNAFAGIEERRLRIYRELFYNNVESCLASAFPVLRKLSSDAVWHARVRDFFTRHRCTAPQFHRLPEEFLRYLEAERGEHADDPPFLRELAHYEWVELALAIAPEDLPIEQADPEGDLLAGCPLLSPLAWPLVYAYPVHRIGPQFQPQAPGDSPTYLIVNRDREDRVRFLEINAVTARLVALIEAEPAASGRALLLRIAAELAHPDPQSVVAQGARILADLRARDIVLGTRR
ncbi:hypothetical protein SAMN04488120_101260 [Fontimonas thermophila]|uniref:Uncharacterized protein n=1 Tax=Fontimonas thermophila TaxID=1076937 RepID=A0A1I2HCT0_9GAMM|nr:putative DNA-binding domain-containing protein [Fontimonas thermophila]SFF26371.1 hypothetical protein SAMN04488120_101260 [Fontimonas thermophila]